MPQRQDMAERRCIVTGEVQDPERLVRFVLAPDGQVVPDVAGRLPGRGLWVTASRGAVERAVRKRLFGRAARAPAEAAADLADRVEALLVRRCLELLGLANRAGLAVSGYEKVRERLLGKGAAALLAAADGAVDGRRRLRRMAGKLPVVEMFSAAELGLALGRESVVHAALAPGGLTGRFLTETSRLAGFRPPLEPYDTADSE